MDNFLTPETRAWVRRVTGYVPKDAIELQLGFWHVRESIIGGKLNLEQGADQLKVLPSLLSQALHDFRDLPQFSSDALAMMAEKKREMVGSPREVEPPTTTRSSLVDMARLPKRIPTDDLRQHLIAQVGPELAEKVLARYIPQSKPKPLTPPQLQAALDLIVTGSTSGRAASSIAAFKAFFNDPAHGITKRGFEGWVRDRMRELGVESGPLEGSSESSRRAFSKRDGSATRVRLNAVVAALRREGRPMTTSELRISPEVAQLLSEGTVNASRVAADIRNAIVSVQGQELIAEIPTDGRSAWGLIASQTEAVQEPTQETPAEEPVLEEAAV
jgi:hypothetical protein